MSFRSLSFKIITCVVLVFALAFTVFIYAYLDIEKRQMLAKSHRVAQALTEVVRRSIRESMLAGDAKRLPAILESHVSVEEITSVRLFHPTTGEVLAEARGTSAEEIPSSLYTSLLAKGPGAAEPLGPRGARVLPVAVPLQNEEQCRACHGREADTLAVLALNVSAEGTYREIAENRLRMIGFGIVTITVISSVIALLIFRLVNTPIQALVTMMDAEIPTDRLVVRRGDEVGYLTVAFNQMLDRLGAHAREQRRADAALRKAHGELEERVRERTRALSATTADLEGEIQQREWAEVSLKATNESLEEALEQLRGVQTRALQQERLRALGQMASGIAHDFNNTLSPIVGFSELLLTEPEILGDRRRAQEYIEMINTAANDAAAVVGRLREFYRNHDGADPFQLVVHDTASRVY